MLKCEYCGKEIKSKGGLTRHMSSCKAKPETEEEKVDDVVVVTKVVELEVAGTEADYYKGHPRRELKLRGLLSRTFDSDERNKIAKILVTEC